MIKLNAKELRVSEPTKEELQRVKRNPITIIVDNVLDTYNIGAIFRVADSIAAKKIYLCGKTETPPYHKIQKASVGTWQWVPWEYAQSAKDAVVKIKQEESNTKIIAIEQHKKSIPYTRLTYKMPIAFIIGHETTGVSNDVIKIADYIVEIPVYGVNRSLNVMVSLAIVSYHTITNSTKI